MNTIECENFCLKYLDALTEIFGQKAPTVFSSVIEQLESLPEDSEKRTESYIRRLLLKEIYQTLPDAAKKLDKLEKAQGHSEIEHRLIDDYKRLPEKLVADHVDLVKQIAATYHEAQDVDNEQSFNDMISVGEEALVKGARKFFEKNAEPEEFRSFIWDYIRRSMREERSREHPVPFKVRQKLKALSELRDIARVERRDLPLEEITAALDLGDVEASELLSIEADWGGGLDYADDVEIAEIKDEHESSSALTMLLKAESQAMLDEALASLDKREKEIIHRLYFDEEKLSNVIDTMELSQSVGKKLHKRALRKMSAIVEGLKPG